ncbi:MAG TPA: glycosyl hydrolase [Bryobacteraceae bacterium]|nr:glycosyl hydrolase [Bryobacteraceae bacterium]
MTSFPHGRRLLLAGGLVLLAALAVPILSAPNPDDLRDGFQNPPLAARLRCYWWWLNGNTDRAAITRDLEEMKAKGYGGAILVDADGSGQQGNRTATAGPMFGTSEWRDLYLHALREAARLDLEISLNIESGWNLGGPGVTPEQGAKLLTWSRITVDGPLEIKQELPGPPAGPTGFYRDIAVLAYPLRHGADLPGNRQPIRQLAAKSAAVETGMSMPPTAPLLEDFPAVEGEEDTFLSDVRDVTKYMMPDGKFLWSAPAGTWEILRLGYTASGAKVSTSSNQWQGLAIDYMDRSIFEDYWKRNVAPLLEIARPYLGRSLKYLVTDSWELGGLNWTPRFRDEFRTRRGYDLLPYLPVVAGRIVNDRQSSGRFLNDLRRTVGDLIVSGHYRPFAELASQYGLGIHPESGGPHGAPIDALETLGVSAFPQTEYWAPSPTHRVKDEERFFLKEASSAAHTYGKTIVAAEGMTSIGPQWEETPATLQPAFDQAITEGMNRLIWHTFTSSPKSMGLPGQEYFAGTHLNPNVTWWRQAGAFASYINRVQFLMQQGRPVADILYYYGDQVPNFVQLKASDPAKILPGYDYDATDEFVLTHRVSARNGELVLPEGVTYRLLVLPDRTSISVDALHAIRKLVSEGASVLGPRPRSATGLAGDEEINAIAGEVWGECGKNGVQQHSFGKGTVYCGQSARAVLEMLKAPPDFEGTGLDYIHRRSGAADIYFTRNTRAEAIDADVTLRVAGKSPERWIAENGRVEALPVYMTLGDGRTRVRLHLESHGSTIVVLRQLAGTHLTRTSWKGPDPALRVSANGSVEIEARSPGRYTATLNNDRIVAADIDTLPPPVAVPGPWSVEFTPGWGAPERVSFDQLTSWTQSADPGIHYYSGTATYSTRFRLPDRLDVSQPLYLDLGEVREIAGVRVNGQDLGILWKKPFRVALGSAARPGLNELRVEVTNLWPNRLIGDELLPLEKRTTRTNITKFKASSPLIPSGLLGPVTVETRQVTSMVPAK